MIRNTFRIVITLFLIFLIINAPILKEEKDNDIRKNAIFVDVSESMGESYKESMKSIKNIPGEISFFAGDISKDEKKIKYKNITDIYGAIENGKTKYNNVVLISDGFHNSKEGTINTSAKIYTLGLSDFDISKDIIMYNCDYKKVISSKEKQLFQFDIFLKGTDEITCYMEFSGKNKEILLKEGKNRIDFHTDLSEGDYSTKALIIPESWEKNKENNSLDLDFSVKKEEISILLKNEKLNPEISFLKSRLRKMGHVEHLFKSDDLHNIDDINVLCEFDTISLNKEKILNFIEEGGLYIGFIDPETSIEENIFFIKKDFIENISVNINIPTNLLKMPFFDIIGFSDENERIWSRNLKIEFITHIESLRKTQELIYTSSKKTLLSVYRYGKGSVIIFHGGPFYKMALSQINENIDNKDIYFNFIKNLISYYGSFDHSIKIKGLKNYYSVGEKVELSVDFEDELNTYSFQLNNKEIHLNGNKISFQTKKEGKNRIELKVFAGNEVLYDINRTFFVVSGLDELASSGIDEEFLKDISNSTGGKYYNFKDIDKLIKELSARNTVVKKIYPSHSLFFILSLLILFSIYLYFDYLKK